MAYDGEWTQPGAPGQPTEEDVMRGRALENMDMDRDLRIAKAVKAMRIARIANEARHSEPPRSATFIFISREQPVMPAGQSLYPW